MPRSSGLSGMVAPVESTPLLAMSYWELVGVVLQALLLPYGGIHKP